MNRRNFLETLAAGLATGYSGHRVAGASEAPIPKQAAGDVSGSGGTGPGYDGVLSIDAAGRIVNGAGRPIMLRGMNVTGLEGQLAQRGWLGNPWGNMSADGSQPTGTCGPNWPAIAKWRPNFIRIPTNALSFLNVTCGELSWGGSVGASSWRSTYAADPQKVYKAALLAAIHGARQIGCYIIIDCHISAPRFTLGGVTHFMGSANQNPFLDYDSGYLYWCDPKQSIVAWLLDKLGESSGHGPTGIGDIIFELFNEPYLNTQAWTLTKQTADGGDSGIRAPATPTSNSYANHVQGCEHVMLNGGWCNWFYQQGMGAPYGIPDAFTSPSNPASPANHGGLPNALALPWRILGYQEALHGIRALGASNIICCNPDQWSNLQSTSRYILPTDSLPVPQIAIGWHAYPNVLNSSTSWPADLDGGPTWHSAADANIAGTGGVGRSIPTILDEWGDVSGPDALQPSRYDQQIQYWVDSQPLGTAHVAHFNWTGPNRVSDTGSYRWALCVFGKSFGFTGGISGIVLRVSSVNGAPLSPGVTFQSVAETGTYIVSQVSGTPGGLGTYVVSIPQSIPSGSTFTAATVEPWRGDGQTFYDWMTSHT